MINRYELTIMFAINHLTPKPPPRIKMVLKNIVPHERFEVKRQTQGLGSVCRSAQFGKNGRDARLRNSRMEAKPARFVKGSECMSSHSNLHSSNWIIIKGLIVIQTYQKHPSFLAMSSVYLTRKLLHCVSSRHLCYQDSPLIALSSNRMRHIPMAFIAHGAKRRRELPKSSNTPHHVHPLGVAWFKFQSY